MKDYKAEYLDLKSRLTDIMGEIAVYYQDNGMEKKVGIIDNLRQKLEENEFSIVVVGEFSAGKSTFLNALMGKNILPTFSGETTATINFLRHIEKNNNREGGIVHYRDGRPDEVFEGLSNDVIEKYVSTKGENVADSIEYLEVFLDSDFLKDNVTLVDSPGLNGIAEHHREITEEQIEKSNAGIFMFRAKQPGSASEFMFLRALKQKVNRVFYLLNQIDQIYTEEGDSVEKVLAGIKKSYKAQFPEETIAIPEFYAISAMQALAARTGCFKEKFSAYSADELEESSQLGIFENRLMKFLTQGDKGRDALLSPAYKLRDFMNDEYHQLLQSKSALEGEVDSGDIENRILEIRSQKEALSQQVKEQEKTIQQSVGDMRGQMADAVAAELERMRKNYLGNLENWQTVEELEDFEADLGNQSNRDLMRISKKLDEKFHDLIADIVSQNYLDIAADINAEAEHVRYDISIDKKYTVQEIDIDYGISAYKEKMNSLEEKIKSFENDMLNAEKSLLQRRRDERQKESLRKEMEALRKEQMMYQNTLTPPAIDRYTTTENVQRDRGGLLGGIAQLFIGKKSEKITVQHVDDRAYNEFKEAESKRNAAYDAERKNFNRQIEDLATNGKSAEEIELEQSRIEKELVRLEQEKESARKQHKEEFERKLGRVLRRKKQYINEYMDDITEEFESKIKKEMREKENVITSMISHAISCEINKQIEAKEADLRILDSQLKSSVEERNSQLAKVNVSLERVGALLEKASDMYDEIDSIEIDCIADDIV